MALDHFWLPRALPSRQLLRRTCLIGTDTDTKSMSILCSEIPEGNGNNVHNWRQTVENVRAKEVVHCAAQQRCKTMPKLKGAEGGGGH